MKRQPPALPAAALAGLLLLLHPGLAASETVAAGGAVAVSGTQGAAAPGPAVPAGVPGPGAMGPTAPPSDPAAPAIAAGAARLAEPEPALQGVDWLRVLTKTLAYETLGSFLEAGVFLAFYGGGASTAGAIFGAALVGASAVYLVHEYAWEALLPAEASRADPTLVATKTVTYRALSMARSFATGSLAGGAGAVASGGYAVTLALLDSGLYALTEFAFAWWRTADTAR